MPSPLLVASSQTMGPRSSLHAACGFPRNGWRGTHHAVDATAPLVARCRCLWPTKDGLCAQAVSDRPRYSPSAAKSPPWMSTVPAGYETVYTNTASEQNGFSSHVRPAPDPRQLWSGTISSIRTRNASSSAGVCAQPVSSRGDAYDNALAETVVGLFKTEVIRRRGPWRSLDAVEFTTLTWVD